ncbi:hypothetical protein [Kineococcus terrestris]|uniref:hypothetical protein n=1 Tax=Kineococcus terrestris TaxID=2044856 RepID=UPI0034DAC182
MTVSPCGDATAAGWLRDDPQPRHRLVTLGPAGFEAYARVRFIPDPTSPGQSEGDVPHDPGPDAPSERQQLHTVLGVLAARTGTPARCVFAVWDGWGAGPVHLGATLDLPNRRFSLFEGAATDLPAHEQWAAVLHPPHGSPEQAPRPDPAFVWPADRAWCVTKDVDAHFAGVGGTRAAIADLLAHPGLDVVPADPARDQPAYQ